MIELKYSEVLKLNKELGNNLKSSSYDITVLSNIIVHQSKEMLEYLLRGEGINAKVKFGDYPLRAETISIPLDFKNEETVSDT